MNYPRHTMLLLPWTRAELPGWGRVLRAAGAFDNDRWRGAPTRSIRGKFHGYQMELDLSNWSERHTFFLGRFYELALQLLMRSYLRPGDTFLDVGANIGMISALAARLVGSGGHVHAFEPNPVPFGRLQHLLASNGLTSAVTAHNVGVSDEAGELTLSVIQGHTGSGTLGNLPPAEAAAVTATYTVPTVRLDDRLPELPASPMFLKIDVEGFECQVLRGGRVLLERFRPLVVTEVSATHLKRGGSTVDDLFGIMRGYGYEPYVLGTTRGRLRHRLALRRPTGEWSSQKQDVVWVSGHEAVKRLAPFLPR